MELVNLSGLTSVAEYLNLTEEFLGFVRASLLATYTDEQFAFFKRKMKIPSVKYLVRSLGLHLPDFVRNENTVAPHRWALNCRRVVMMRSWKSSGVETCFWFSYSEHSRMNSIKLFFVLEQVGFTMSHQSRVIILSGCQPFRLCSQFSLFLNIVSKETSVLHCITALCTL